VSRVAAIQMVSGTTVEDNLAEAAALIARAAAEGAGLVVLPENFASMPRDDGERLAAAETPTGGPVQTFLSAQAAANGVWLVGGTIPLRGEAPQKVRSACLLYDDRGRQVARYDKIHLFDVTLERGEAYRESRSIEAGNEIVVVPTPFGRLGLAVCYDLRFPELFRAMLDRGAELLTLPSAFTATTGRAHWDVLVRARAIENLAYVVAANQGGHHANGRDTYGHSMVVGPWGEVLAQQDAGPGAVVGRMDAGHLARVREALPSIAHRRVG
jgi:predicted amidohydrolase